MTMKKSILNKPGYTCRLVMALLTAFGLSGCIENDIPYPYTAGNITEIEVSGMIGGAEIKNTTRSIVLQVSDTVDVASLRVTRLLATNDASIFPDVTKCIQAEAFPEKGFESLDSLETGADTRINFLTPVAFLVKTYQDYPWTITVNPVIERKAELTGQVGNAVFDVKNKQAVIYVAESQSLKNITVNALQLGSSVAVTQPEPTSVKDFSRPVAFQVTAFGRTEEWVVNVLYAGGTATTGNVFPRTKGAVVKGDIETGATVEVEYKEKTAASWEKVAAANVVVSGSTFMATISGLKPSTAYLSRSLINGKAGKEQDFTTATAEMLNNGSFDNWSQDAAKPKLWYPWAADGSSYWDTGNKGATLVGGDSNSAPTTETSTGSGRAAKLESKYILVKFAAGNIFSGTYVKTDGTDGVLSFGRPFTSFPSNLKIHYKYSPKTIDRTNDQYAEYAYLKGRPDSCCIYIALTDRAEPFEIRTKPSNRQLFDKNDKSIIAYAEFVSGQETTSYQEIDLKLNYRSMERTPKYMVIVATSSKYGDYFTGGEGSTLWIDDFVLEYE